MVVTHLYGSQPKAPRRRGYLWLVRFLQQAHESMNTVNTEQLHFTWPSHGHIST